MKSVQEKVSGARHNIQSLIKTRAFNLPLDRIHQCAQRIDELQYILGVHEEHRLMLAVRNTKSLHQRLVSLNPDHVLRRGYVIVQKNGRAMNSAMQLQKGDKVGLKFHDGQRKASIEDSNE